MSEKYTLLLCSILDSSVWREDSDVCKVWVTLLAMADEEGYIGASVGGVAHRAHLPRDVTEAAITKFMGPDPDSRCPDLDGARLVKVERGWKLANYSKLRAIIAEERERQRKAEWARQQRRTRTGVDARSEAGTKSSGSDQDQIRSRSDQEADAGSRARAHTRAREGEPAQETGGGGRGGGSSRDRGSPGRPLRSLEDALALPVEARAQACQHDPTLADFAQPQEWPEVKAVAAELGQSLGQTFRLGSYLRDRGVQAVVEAFATGFTLDQLLSVARNAKDDPWWHKERRGLSSLTAEVIRRGSVPPGREEHEQEQQLTPHEKRVIENAKKWRADEDRKAAANGGK